VPPPVVADGLGDEGALGDEGELGGEAVLGGEGELAAPDEWFPAAASGVALGGAEPGCDEPFRPDSHQPAPAPAAANTNTMMTAAMVSGRMDRRDGSSCRNLTPEKSAISVGWYSRPLSRAGASRRLASDNEAPHPVQNRMPSLFDRPQAGQEDMTYPSSKIEIAPTATANRRR
jgi:hypothetical protein